MQLVQTTKTSFPSILRDKLIPWAKSDAADRIVIPSLQMGQYMVPSGVTLTSSPMRGKRTAVRGERLYNNARLIYAKWPKMGMHEVASPRYVTVVQGAISFQAGNNLLGCKSGDSLFLKPGIPHCANKHHPSLVRSQSPNAIATLLWMAEYRGSVQCWLSHYSTEERFGQASENFLFLKNQPYNLFHLLTEELESEQKDNSLCNTLLLGLWQSLKREVESKNYLHPGPIVQSDDNKVGHKSTFEAELEEFISRHLNEHLTLEYAARKLHTSRTQLIRQIRQETGQTFVEFLNAYRLKEAKLLLAQTDWLVQAIAHFVGFQSVSYFYQIFKEHTDLSPLKYRQNSTASNNSEKNVR